MIPNMPALGIRFNVRKIESGTYGVECWKIFWRSADIHKLGGVLLYEGDIAATLDGRENVYCIVVQSMNPQILEEIRASLKQSVEFQSIAALPQFGENNRVIRFPLSEAGKVDVAGNLIGKAYNSREALVAVQQERPAVTQADTTTNPIR